ncbi:multidrug DMT transporter permease [Humibacter ginsenosidimutans]|uniref:Multidrug DMT transporter permease n=2 Tax=Humibacter ginsenosidimutans TaxID=2599293 RepID=A0A5B8M8C9_9MICO|nr:multidrug DMT transporter permease [Humibacter ginsenosidimutans]
MSIGAQLQHRGVTKVELRTDHDGRGGLQLRQLRLLLARPSWVLGTIMLGLAIVLQLTSLVFSPLIVVQPLGAVSLVITAIINARVSKTRLNKRSILAICLCVGGVGAFVLVAAFAAREVPVTEANLVTILIVLGVVLVVAAVAFAIFRRNLPAIGYVVGAGILYGFVATLAKSVISRIEQQQFDWLTVCCLIALLAAVILGAYFVQNAYASGPPDLVIAGLTVIDPLVAVTIGITILNEAAGAAGWQVAAFVAAGVVAIVGVFLLARVHPGVRTYDDNDDTQPASGQDPA